MQYHRLCELEPESERDSDFFRVSEDAFEAVSPLAVVLPVSEYEALFFVSLSLFGIEFTEPYGGLIRFILLGHRTVRPAHVVIALGVRPPCRDHRGIRDRYGS